MVNEHDRARRWREAHGWDRQELGERIGYSKESVYWAEKGMTPPGRTKDGDRRIEQRTWLRYKNACAAIEAETRGFKFRWEAQ